MVLIGQLEKSEVMVTCNSAISVDECTSQVSFENTNQNSVMNFDLNWIWTLVQKLLRKINGTH